MKILKRLSVLTLIGSSIALIESRSLEMAAVVLLNSFLLLYLEWRARNRRKER